ncbi:hypothetical protein AAU61_12060 [Desulfocarbo indianensis]|nr:hypothetical protein AAU61_12060 [Desulfocarbo indianensis]
MANTTKKITIKDIARIAEVSPATVSLVLNGKKGISKETRYRILRIASELKFTPNLAARSLAKQHTNLVSLTILQARNSLFMEIASGVEEVLQSNGYSLIIVSTYDDPDLEVKELTRAQGRGVDGIIVSSAMLDSRAVREVVEEGVPLVSVLRKVQGLDHLNYVAEDSFRGGYLAGEHLVKLGHKRIGILTGTPNTSTGFGRLQGALQALCDAKVPVNEKLIMYGEFAKEPSYLATLSMLKVPDKELPTAIYACNDDMAMGAYEAALDSGLKVPEDLALVGFNNAAYTSLQTIGLTTIDVQAHEMGRLGAERLLELIRKKRGYKKPLQVVMDPKLIVRRTCGAKPKEDA